MRQNGIPSANVRVVKSWGGAPQPGDNLYTVYSNWDFKIINPPYYTERTPFTTSEDSLFEVRRRYLHEISTALTGPTQQPRTTRAAKRKTALKPV
jgi:hypothetical protein